LLITEPSQRLPCLVIVHRSNADATDGGLELDKRVSVVVPVAWVGLAVLAEIGVVADSALVADTFDIRQALFVLAQWTVAVNAVVTVTAVERLSQGLVDGHKAMARMDVLSILDAIWAVIPVWAVQTFVTDAIDEPVAAVADSWVTNVSPRVAKEVSQSGKRSIRCSRCESVAGMMAVLVPNVAFNAQIVVLTSEASDELLLWQALDAAVAGAGWFVITNDWLLLVCVGSRNFLSLLGLGLGGHALSGAVDDTTVLHESLDHPVARTWAVDARVNASRAQVVVASVADAAVEVLVFHGMVAVVAVHDPRGAGSVRLRAECKISIVGGICEVVEEAWVCC
jgi:hypothetical protein